MQKCRKLPNVDGLSRDSACFQDAVYVEEKTRASRHSRVSQMIEIGQKRMKGCNNF
jgi:hypothetical protein